MQEKRKNAKGITLVALIITVIILLILAGVTISLVIGENGLINKSKETSKATYEKDIQESLELAIADLEISKTESGEKVEITDLLEKGYINEEGVININKLLGKKGQYGNGTNKQDVFIIENNELWYYEKSGEGKKISELSNLGYLVTPDKYFEVYETSINLEKYNDYYKTNYGATEKEAPLETYVIPNKINETTLDTVGHFNAPNIKRIIIKEGFRYIGTGSFQGCSSLEKAEIPNSVTGIWSVAFAGCTSLESINIPNSVLGIGKQAFNGCEKLNNINLKEGLKTIGEMTFGDCKRLVNLKIPRSVEIIGESAFRNCTSLKNVNISEKVTKINSYTFENCKSLENITIPESITEIGHGAFSGCTSLNSIDIPNNVTSIEGAAFSECTNLTNIKMPKNITKIDIMTFINCTKLKTITIPKKVKYISGQVFQGCKDLKTINYEGTEEEWEAINISGGNDELTNATINYNYKYEE